MRSLMPRGPARRHLDGVLLRITEREVKEAISLSVALKRPERSFGAIIASRASSFTDGSARVYISVVCMWACPSQSETFRRSLVACSTVSAQVCLSTCGDTRFVDKEGHAFVAVLTCLSRMYSKPDRVMAWPRALRKSSGVGAGPRIASHARNTVAVIFQSGRERSRRPLPWTTMLA